jgi:thiamine biosynthesis protein ThiI
MEVILIKYGELTTKKGNRNTFIHALKENIKLLVPYDIKISAKFDRMYIETTHINEVSESLKKIFGIYAFTIAHVVPTNEDDIIKESISMLKESSFNTFKVDTKRSYKEFPKTSMEFSAFLGGKILNNFKTKVDIHNPELILHIEIHKDNTYLYFKNIHGVGGYPVGIQGKGMLMLSGGIDSPVAGYLALKRGIDVIGLYFESRPHTSLEARDKVITLSSKLNAYSGHMKLLIVPFTELQEAIYKNCDPTYNITIMRRMMYRIATRLAKRYKCHAIINGESVGQVASQTLTSMEVINEVTSMPVIRPVACLDKLEIIKIAEDIDTYKTSILPYEDCCTIFVPEHPIINPNLQYVKEQEATFDYETMVAKCVKDTILIKDFTNKDTNLL